MLCVTSNKRSRRFDYPNIRIDGSGLLKIILVQFYVVCFHQQIHEKDEEVVLRYKYGMLQNCVWIGVQYDKYIVVVPDKVIAFLINTFI